MNGFDVRLPPQRADRPSHGELATLQIDIHQNWPSLQAPIVLSWSDSPAVALDSSGTAWIYGPVERDPLRGSHGRSVVPRKQLTELKHIAELGVPFKRLAI